MILVDTSVWIEHLRSDSKDLRARLHQEQVLAHPFVLGELACGNLKKRHEILSLYRSLPQARLVDDLEALHFLEQERLYGLDLGWIDVHLLASARLSGSQLWTLDKALSKAAQARGVGSL